MPSAWVLLTPVALTFSLRDGSTPSTRTDTRLNQVSSGAGCGGGAGGGGPGGLGVCQGAVPGLPGGPCAHTVLSAWARHHPTCTYMGVCRHAGENRGRAWMPRAQTHIVKHLLCASSTRSSLCTGPLGPPGTPRKAPQSFPLTAEAGGSGAPSHTGGSGGRLDRPTGSRGHAPHTPAAHARVLYVWMQSPHVCAQRTYVVVCAHRLICGALVNMAAWFLQRHGRAWT